MPFYVRQMNRVNSCNGSDSAISIVLKLSLLLLLQWKTNRKSHTGFRLVSVTLNDRIYNTPPYPIQFSGARCLEADKERPNLSTWLAV